MKLRPPSPAPHTLHPDAHTTFVSNNTFSKDSKSKNNQFCPDDSQGWIKKTIWNQDTKILSWSHTEKSLLIGKYVSPSQGPHSHISMTGGGGGGGGGGGALSNFFGSEILAKSDFLGFIKGTRNFLDLKMKQRDFLGLGKKKTKGFFEVC